jgi:hypothetical protein
MMARLEPEVAFAPRQQRRDFFFEEIRHFQFPTPNCALPTTPNSQLPTPNNYQLNFQFDVLWALGVGSWEWLGVGNWELGVN